MTDDKLIERAKATAASVDTALSEWVSALAEHVKRRDKKRIYRDEKTAPPAEASGAASSGSVVK